MVPSCFSFFDFLKIDMLVLEIMDLCRLFLPARSENHFYENFVWPYFDFFLFNSLASSCRESYDLCFSSFFFYPNWPKAIIRTRPQVVSLKGELLQEKLCSKYYWVLFVHPNLEPYVFNLNVFSLLVVECDRNINY